MIQTATRRELDLTVAHNVRHLGGYQGPLGFTSESVFRAAGLHRLTQQGVGQLRDHGVRVVVDLRSAAERERDVTPDLSVVGIRRLEAPVFESDASPVSMDDAFAGFAPVYRSMLENGRAAYRSLFETIADTEDGILFHCSAGKDRTGVAAALLLDLAVVPDDAIAADYALSATLLEPLIREWIPRVQERGVSEEKARAIMGADPADILATLRTVRRDFGSAAGYMSDLGMSTASISALRARMLA